MPLSATAVRAAKPRQKPYKLHDEKGLLLIVQPSGARWWRLKYRHAGSEKGISLGTFPDISLARARERRDAARRLIADGIDPSAQRKAEKVAQGDTFEAIAREWLQLQSKKLSLVTLKKARWIFEDLLFPRIGPVPIGKLTAPDVLSALRRIESRGKHETAHRARQRVSQVMRFAVATGRATQDVTATLRGALTPVTTVSRPAITEPARVGELMRAIDGYEGQPSTVFALRILPRVFVRPGELRGARWAEFDLENTEWRIPAERMKMREQHLVPLSRQVIKLLADLREWTGDGELLFPSLTSLRRPISENTLNSALRRLGYSGDQMVAHGFRSIASTLLNELGFHPDLIELQLAHRERSTVRAAYNRAQRLTERRKMMVHWSDHLEELKAGAKVVALKRSA